MSLIKQQKTISPHSCRFVVMGALYMKAATAVLEPLDALQHTALHFMTGHHFSTIHSTLYTTVGWPSVKSHMVDLVLFLCIRPSY